VRWPQWAIACAIVISATIVFIARRSRLEITALSQRTIVAPFRIVGGDASLDYLREGMVELLSAHLDDESAAATPDAGTVIQAWRRAGVNRSGAPSRDSMVSLAARMGAERVIIGSIVATQRRAIMSASLITAASREINAVGRVEGPVDSLTALVDQLAAQLLAAEAGLPAVAAKRTSPSLPALRAFLAGSSAYNGGDYAIAADRFQRALDFDSSFAVAAFRLGLTARHLNAFQLERHALNRAWQFRADLNRRDGAHLLALLGPRYPDVSSQSETLVAWEDALRIAPDRAEVLYGFASYLTERNGYQLSDHQRERAVAALDRALAVDPSYGHVHLLRFMLSDSASNAPNGFPPFLRWRLALVREDTAELRQTRDSLIRFGPGNLRAIAAASQFDGIDLRTGTRAIAVLQARGPSASEALDLLLAAHSFRILTSDAGGTSDILREMQRVNPATGAHLRLRVLDSLYASTDSTAASVAAQELARDLAANQSSSAADACVLGQWQLMRGDTVALRSTMNVLHASNNNEPTLVGTPATFCVPLLNAALAVYQGQPNARDRVLALDTLVLTSTASGDLSTYGHIAVCRLHRRVGNSQAALQAIRRRPYLAGGWPRYLATTHLEEGELAQLTGDTAGAVTAYSRYMALRSGSPDPRFDVIVALRDSLASQLRNIAH
jgi:tetratricopeptide (TPR) repeat protein